MSILASEIKTIIEGQGLVYYRAVNINDLNEFAGTTDLAAGIGVHTNLPNINSFTPRATGNVWQNHLVEVFYMKLTSIDPTGEQLDVILDELLPLADELYDKLQASTIRSKANSINGYTVTAAETLKQTKEWLSGWKVTLQMPIDRTVFYCA